MKNISPPIFYYHSVAPEPYENWVLKGLTLQMENFEAQMVYLKSRGMRTIFLDEWFAIRTGAKNAIGKELCLGFDDGLLDNWVYAYPIAKKYGMRFTLFVALECLDPREIVRPTLEDVWAGHCREEDLEGRGYLTWNEVKLMQESGVVDIQSHTMSHEKYIASSRIKSFYYGGASGVYPIWNANPGLKPFYIADETFEQRLPWGTPLFEESSSVTVRKHTANSEFIEQVLALAKNYNLHDRTQQLVFEETARQISSEFQNAGNLISHVESEQDYQARLVYEIVDSKAMLEDKLEKPVRFLCWPHGDNTHAAHVMAKEAGYLATTSGKLRTEKDKMDRIPRIPGDFRNSPWVNRQKFHYKIASHYQKQPYYSIWLANEFKNRILQHS